MKFDQSKVYTCLNADELEIGSQIVIANNLHDLKNFIEKYDTFDERVKLKRIMPETYEKRFVMSMGEGDTPQNFALAYFIAPPQKFNHEDVLKYLKLEKHLSETYSKELRDLNIKYKDDFYQRQKYQEEISEWFLKYFNFKEQDWDSYDLDFDFLQEFEILKGTWQHNDYEDCHYEFMSIEVPKNLILKDLSETEIENCIIEDEEE